MAKRFYIAYGSNLNLPQMRGRCPGATIVGTAVIENYRLLFKGSKMDGVEDALLLISANADALQRLPRPAVRADGAAVVPGHGRTLGVYPPTPGADELPPAVQGKQDRLLPYHRTVGGRQGSGSGVGGHGGG